jgi:hypothetical protein
MRTFHVFLSQEDGRYVSNFVADVNQLPPLRRGMMAFRDTEDDAKQAAKRAMPQPAWHGRLNISNEALLQCFMNGMITRHFRCEPGIDTYPLHMSTVEFSLEPCQVLPTAPRSGSADDLTPNDGEGTVAGDAAPAAKKQRTE